MAVLILLNNFLHDFSAAGWVVGSVVLWVLLRRGVPDDEGGNIIVSAVSAVLWLMRLSFVGIIGFGIVRTFAYKSFEWSDAAGSAQVTLLLFKHIFFTVIFAIGLVYYVRASRLVRKRHNGKS